MLAQIPPHEKRARVHEVSVALGLIEAIRNVAGEQNIERVAAVNVRIGALSGIVREALLFSWDVATAGTLAAGSELRVEEIPLIVFCEYCEGEREPRPGSGLICPECGTPAPRIVRGREMQLVSLEVPA
jgi:hydrogenase nickel incorporation protein HypA/HybF